MTYRRRSGSSVTSGHRPPTSTDRLLLSTANASNSSTTTRSCSSSRTPETKRRWSPRDYDAEFWDAYKNWLLDRIERLIEDQAQPTIVSARQLAAQLQRDSEIQAVAEVYTNESAPDLEHLAIDLVKAEGVPYVAALRYTDTGLEKAQRLARNLGAATTRGCR